jgi:multidrug efflux pump subunit AcrA (membrane-fusion protein)
MNRALSTGDGTEAGILRNEAEFWSAEVARAQERLQATRILSPINGVVATPHVEDFTGKRLQFGDRFAEVINSAETSVDVAVDEHDIALLRNKEKAWIKLDAFPNRTFQGTVAVVSPDAAVNGDERVFFARVIVPNPARLLRAGMQGRGKVMTGWRPAGNVIFRRFGIAVWTKLWSMFGW